MYVCLCRGITERQIQRAAENGVTTLKDLRRELGLGQDCGVCADCAKQCLHSANQDVREPAKLAACA